MKDVTRRVLPFLFTLALIMVVSALGAASGSAEVVHDFQFSFNGSTTPNGFQDGLGPVAFDHASGDLYVEDWQSGGIYKFSATGEYLWEIDGESVPQGSLGLFYYDSGIAVDNSGGVNNGDLYVAGTENGVIYKFDSSGKFLTQLTGEGTPAGSASFRPRGLAVDTNGDLYVADAANDVVDKFDAAGDYISQIVSTDITNPATIAVDSSGNVYLNNKGESTVKLEPGGTASVLDLKGTESVAVDSATDDVYVTERNEYPAPGEITEYDSSGNRLGAFGGERLGSVAGIAVSSTTGEVYAADYSNNLIDVFGPAVVIPDATTNAASDVLPRSAMLAGSVDPDGLQVSACQFEYGTSVSYGQSSPCAQSPAAIGSGASPVAVSAGLSGQLLPDTVYHFRLSVSNANGTNHGADLTFTTPGPPRVDSESTASLTHTSAVLQAQVDPFGYDTTYHFEYGTTASYGTSIPVPDADIGSGMSDVSISQEVGKLLPGIVYHYRVVATSSQGKVAGPDRTFTTIPPALIDGEWTTDVAATSATLNAQIDPLGTSTEYRLEYGTNTSYGETLSGSAGDGEADVLVSDHRQSLLPGTTYHYRVVTSSALGTVEGPDRTFTTQAASGQELTLPDGRAWELVSPPSKSGSLIDSFGQDPIQAASDGSGITYGAFEPIGENEPAGRSALLSQILSTRGRNGWGTQDISPPHALGDEEEMELDGFEYRMFSPDLSLAAIVQTGNAPLQLSSEATEGRLYLRNDLEGKYLPLLTPMNVPSGTKLNSMYAGSPIVRFLAATPDLSELVLKSPLALTPEAPSGDLMIDDLQENLYEWNAGRLQLVSILPPPSGRPELGATLAGEGRGNGSEGGAPRSISSDGRWVAWTLGSPEEGNLQLYARNMVEKKSVRIGGDDARYQTMNSDGSRIFFLENGDLYEFDTTTDTQSDLTADHGAAESSAGVKETLLGVSEDGSYVYFVATGVLAGASGAVAGEDNVYAMHDEGGEWTTSYVTTLSSSDEHDWYVREFGNYSGPALEGVRSRVSPDGRYLAFMSDRPLTGYDNIDANSGQRDQEVYLYDALRSRLICASCDPTGARPVGILDTGNNILMDRNIGNPSTFEGQWVAGMIPGWDTGNLARSLYQPRYLSDSGRLFFDTPDALVPQDTNGLMDAYEYEPAGVGSCTAAGATFSERPEGCVSLLSSGTSSAESAFLDASETGDDVFFLTTSDLTPQNSETSYSVYDAHVCSVAVPCTVVPVSPPPCDSGDSCKAAPAPQPEIFGAPASATFAGAGNVLEEAKPSAVKPKGKPKAKHKVKAKRRTKKRHRAKRAVTAHTDRASRKDNR